MLPVHLLRRQSRIVDLPAITYLIQIRVQQGTRSGPSRTRKMLLAGKPVTKCAPAVQSGRGTAEHAVERGVKVCQGLQVHDVKDEACTSVCLPDVGVQLAGQEGGGVVECGQH